MKQMIVLMFIAICSLNVFAQNKVETFNINGKEHYGIKAIPKELVGLYKYEKTQEPIVEINANGTGKFQVHGVTAYPTEFWIETDKSGNIQKVTGEGNPNYQYVLILKFGSNGESGWKGSKNGTYERIQATVAITLGYVIVLGERFKPL